MLLYVKYILLCNTNRTKFYDPAFDGQFQSILVYGWGDFLMVQIAQSET